MVASNFFAFAYHAYILNCETSTLIHSYKNKQLRRACQIDFLHLCLFNGQPTFIWILRKKHVFFLFYCKCKKYIKIRMHLTENFPSILEYVYKEFVYVSLCVCVYTRASFKTAKNAEFLCSSLNYEVCLKTVAKQLVFCSKTWSNGQLLHMEILLSSKL